MDKNRNLLGWLLLGLVGAVGLGGAVLGIALAPGNAGLTQAATNTRTASGYTEVIVQNTSQGSQSARFQYRAPDHLGGFVQSGAQRTYIFVIGQNEYQSVTVSARSGSRHLLIYRQPGAGAKNVDPAQQLLALVADAKHVTNDGDLYSFEVTKQGTTGHLTAVVTGNYVTSMTVQVQTETETLHLSDVGTLPDIHLPSGARIANG
jgi:hypothetical protein